MRLDCKRLYNSVRLICACIHLFNNIFLQMYIEMDKLIMTDRLSCFMTLRYTILVALKIYLKHLFNNSQLIDHSDMNFLSLTLDWVQFFFSTLLYFSKARDRHGFTFIFVRSFRIHVQTCAKNKRKIKCCLLSLKRNVET